MDRAVDIRRQIQRVYATTMREELKENGDDDNEIVFRVNRIKFVKYYENIIKALLSGHFMNIAVKGFGDNYWRFRLLDLDENNKAVDIVDKAKCHQNSMFAKNASEKDWFIYGDVSITHTTQLKMLTAIEPQWLLEIDSNSYYQLGALQNDQTPISEVLKKYSFCN